MGRELQKKKRRAGRKPVRQSNKTKKILNPRGNNIIAENWDKKATLSQNYRRLGLVSRLRAPTGGVESPLDKSSIAALRAAHSAADAASSSPLDLLSITQIAPFGTLAFERLAAALRALDGVISGKDEPYLPPRSRYVQLFHFLKSLRSKIERDKKRGLIEPENHRTNATLAYELYRNAQDTPATTTHLHRLRLIGSRWKDTVRSSPFLLLAFSKTAESFT
ncbi:hypothetical protein ARSEF1564_003211 [Beauveria bassiana]